MTSPLVAGMLHLEAGRVADAEQAFAAAAGPSGDGVIARFRRAECLSRLLRHDEAVAEAVRAAEDAPDRPSAAIWLARTLAEAGRFADAAAVAWPAGHDEFLDPLRSAYRALEIVSRGRAPSREEGREACAAILASRHAATFSLALRMAETARLAAEPRWPDPPSVWFAHCCREDLRERGEAHPPPPLPRDAPHPTRAERGAAIRWLRDHAACSFEPELLRAVRASGEAPDDLDEIEAEMLLAHGKLDECEALLAAIAGRTEASELGAVYAVTACRTAQLRGRAARPAEFAGGADPSGLADDFAWLECCAAILSGDAAAARTAADRIADPSRPAYVEASLRRWAEA